MSSPLKKAPTGIEGLDESSGGGLPAGRTTLIMGGPGCGKTVLALQTLVNGAVQQGEPGIFVAFEESKTRILENAAGFGWDLEGLQKSQLFFLDVQLPPDQVQSGRFDLQGLLAALESKVQSLGARRIVFDSVDVLLSQIGDPRQERCEANRLHEWLLARNLTALITAKVLQPGPLNLGPFGFLQFMVDCALLLTQELTDGIRQRNLSIVKYRGSGFVENEMPLVIGPSGVEIAGVTTPNPGPCSLERISTGVARLDTMLDGGYHRGSTVLVSGSPGTAKTTLGGAFLEAACLRGESCLFVSFDSSPDELVRNLASVNLQLQPHIDSGLLHTYASRTLVSRSEFHLVRICALGNERKVRCLVVDPISALINFSTRSGGQNLLERLIAWAKTQGVTVMCTSLLGRQAPEVESTPSHTSTLADTWIHLSYLIQSGERNRALTIIKSRGTGHSNQVRELLLSKEGINLADVYTADGEVLMGTRRWQRERAEQEAKLQQLQSWQSRRGVLETEQAELQSQLSGLNVQLKGKQAELELLETRERDLTVQKTLNREQLRELRRADS